MVRVYQNLGKKSEILKFLTRWAVVGVVYRLLMGAMRIYWKIFMRITQAISRRQELRSDELAYHIAGSQALIDGLECIRRCHAVLNSYWNSVVLPVAASGFQPQVAEGFSALYERAADCQSDNGIYSEAERRGKIVPVRYAPAAQSAH